MQCLLALRAPQKISERDFIERRGRLPDSDEIDFSLLSFSAALTCQIRKV